MPSLIPFFHSILSDEHCENNEQNITKICKECLQKAETLLKQGTVPDIDMSLLKQLTKEICNCYEFKTGRKDLYVQLTDYFLSYKMGELNKNQYLVQLLQILFENKKLHLSKEFRQIILCYGKSLAGEEVFAGTSNQEGVLHIRAKKIGKETVLSNIIRLVEKAQSSRPPVQKFANTIVSYFIPVILTIAIIVFCIWYFILGGTLLFSLTCLISILVVACPCALGLATPTAVTVGVGRAAEFGILIKNGDTLENAGQIDVAAFDKPGTITEGKPEVDAIIA